MTFEELKEELIKLEKYKIKSTSKLINELNQYKQMYDELNDFNNSQVKKLIIKNEELQNEIKDLKCKNGTLIDYKDTLETQVKKMRNCMNCVYMNCLGNCKKEVNAEGHFRFCSKWELRWQ